MARMWTDFIEEKNKVKTLFLFMKRLPYNDTSNIY